jgi:hypothetical protein
MDVHVVGPPLPRSYVVFLPVIAGEYPGAPYESQARARIQRVMDEGPDFFLDLTEPGELEPYAHLLPPHARHVRLPLRRGAVPPAARVREILDTIDRASGDGWFLYVHDNAGIGRVGTVIGCWLADMEILDRDPIAFLDAQRRHVFTPWRESPATPEQRAFVRGWTRGRRPAVLTSAESGQRPEGGSA